MLTLEAFRQTPEYIECSDKVRMWLVALIENGFDYTAATRAAFDAKDPVKYGHAVRNWPTVRAALSVYREMSAFERWFEATQRAFHNRRTSVAQMQALKMQADAMGWNAEGLSARLHGKPIPPIQPAAAISKPQAAAYPAPAPTAEAMAMGSANDVQIFPPVPRRDKIGDIVQYKNAWYKTTAIDENGKASAGDRCDEAGNLIPEDTPV